MLHNSSPLPLSGFRLAFTSLFPLVTDGQLQGARVVDLSSNYHVIAPPVGFTLLPGACWLVSGHLGHTLGHYTSALKSAYVILENGTLAHVAATPTTRNRESGVPRLDVAICVKLPHDATPAAILPFPFRVSIAGRRGSPNMLGLAGGPREAELAFDAAADLAQRLFPSEPPLFARTGGIVYATRSQDMAEEAYRIVFAADVVTLLAAGRTGFFYGFVTLAQMLRGARQAPDQFTFPSTGEIVDAPRFAWRGMLLDVARQVFPSQDLISLLDWLAWHKLNRFHLHLTDDEGWRLDIPGYPQLAERAGWRGHGLAIPPLLGSPPDRYGLVYSRADAAQLTRRAAELAIVLVPEIEMPGHSYAILQAIPELQDPDDTGIHRNVLNPAVPKTYDLLATVLEEVTRLFPSPWIHIGADEVPRDAWLHSPLALAHMQKCGWSDTYQLQSYFLRQVQDIIRGLGCRIGAWEEAALGAGLDSRDCYLVGWRTSASGIALAEQGYNVVLAPGEAYYLDMAQSEDWWEPGMDWAGTVSPERCYSYDPAGDWPDELKPQLVGVQACLWSEHLHDRSLFNRLTVPRLAAVAESAWTASGSKDFTRFLALSRFMPKPPIR